MPSDKKGGGGPMGGLWMGTAVFAALKAKDFGGFVKSYVWYAAIIIISAMVLIWVLKSLGVIERFTGYTYPRCPEPITGPSPNGDVKCTDGAGNVRIY